MRTHHTDIKVTFKSGSGLQHVTVTIRTRLDLLPTISRAALPPQAPGENPPLLLPASRRSKHFLASGCLTPVSACLHRAFSSSPCVLSYSVFFSETMNKTSLEHSHTHSCVFTPHTHTHTHTHTTAEFNSCHRNTQPTKPKMFTVWRFTEKVCRPLFHSIHFIHRFSAKTKLFKVFV